MMGNWKDLFSEVILERGLDYYESGAVENLEITSRGYTAIVSGSEDYEVEIELDDQGNICEMFCDCPYAEDGSYCKHMAGVLYAIEREQNIEKPGKGWKDSVGKTRKELEAAIQNIPESELRVLLLKIAEGDEVFKNHILTRYSEEVSENQMIRLKKEVDKIINRNLDWDGSVSWKNVETFTFAIKDLLYDQVQALIDRGCNMQAFELTNYIFQEVGNLDMEDSGEGTYEIEDICYEFWTEILSECSDDEKRRMSQWFKEHRGKLEEMGWFEEYLNDFLIKEMKDRKVMQETLVFLDKEIAKADKETANEQWRSAYYDWERNVLKRLDIMEDLEYSAEEIKAYRKKNWQFEEIRKIEIRECLNDGDILRAIEILQESKELDKDYAGRVEAHSVMLIQLYQKQNMKKEYKDELLFLIFSFSQRNLEYVKKLKEICGEKEWEGYRDKLLSGRKGWQMKYPLLEMEGMYGRMMEEILAEDSIFQLDQYEKVLKEKFPEKVRDTYLSYVQEHAQNVSSRNQYKELVGYLKKIKDYPNGKELVDQVVKEWKVQYRRRPAMMDELKRGGLF